MTGFTTIQPNCPEENSNGFLWPALFSNSPKILFADEPTGNLDAETSEKVIKLLFDLNAEAGTTLIIVTHNTELAAGTRRIIRLKGGTVFSDERKS